ncbi:hypothetical protein BDW74DRAFT_178584 [Aspergillus multicolor]|uniref:uncharacterized protein n=1 Tax=Aspergillus multicolor TaxID=41759 RepID=UPI003CCD4769
MDVGVGDIIQGAKIVWAIYTSLKDGPGGARSDFASFKNEFNLVRATLEDLQAIAKKYPGEDLDLGDGYQQTIKQCASFINKHKSLTREAGTRRSFQDRLSSAWDTVSWPLERAEAELLRAHLEGHIHFANLRLSVNNREDTRQIRTEHVEILRAVRAMSAQVSLILRRCGPNEADAFDAKYRSRIHRHRLSHLLEPIPALNAIPENDVIPQSKSDAILQRIQVLTGRLESLATRLDTIGRQPTPSPERISPLKRSDTSDSIDSDTTIIAPVIGLLDQIGDEVQEALDKVGYEHVVVPGRQRPSSIERATNALNNAAEDWDLFKKRLQFRIMHPLDGPSPRIDFTLGQLEIDPEPDPPPSTPPHSISSPDNSLSPRQLPPARVTMRHTGSPMTRTWSFDSDSPQSPVSAASTCRRRSSSPPQLLAEHPVQVLFPDPNHRGSYVHPPVTCTVIAFLDPRSSRRDVIEGSNNESGVKIVHSLDRDNPSKKVKDSMMPYLMYSRHSLAAANPLSIGFMGSHRIEISDNGLTDILHVAPICVCSNKQDFERFQNILLRRAVLFCGDVKLIHSSTLPEGHCFQETVRVLQDPTGALSILYFGSHRGPLHSARFIDIPISDFSSPKREGKTKIRLPIPGTRRHSMTSNLLPRRNSVESTTTTTSHESRASRASGASSSASDLWWKREKWLQFDFVTEEDSEAFLTALQQ